MAERCQPRWPAVVGIWAVVGCEYPSDNILVEVQAERQVDLLGDAGTAISWIAPFHRNDGINDFSGWTLWTSLLPAVW